MSNVRSNTSISQRMRALQKRVLRADGSRLRAARPVVSIEGEVIEGEAAWLVFNSAQRVCASGQYVTVAIGAPGGQRLAVFDTSHLRLAMLDGDMLAKAARELFAEADMFDAALAFPGDDE